MSLARGTLAFVTDFSTHELTFAVSQLLQGLLVSEGELFTVSIPFFSGVQISVVRSSILRVPVHYWTPHATPGMTSSYAFSSVPVYADANPSSLLSNLYPLDPGPPNLTGNPQPTFPDLTTNCRRELMFSELFADLDFLTGAIVVEDVFLGIM